MIPGGGLGQPPYTGTQQPALMSVQHQPTGVMPRQQIMQGQVMMPYQTVMPVQQFPVQPAVFNPQMNPGYVLRAPVVHPQCVIPPPQYTPQMAQEFRAKQSQKQQGSYADEQRKKLEHLQKQRQFEDQQKRLKEFSSLGGRKIDATSMIESIIGKTEPAKTQSAKSSSHILQRQNESTNNSSTVEDDGFGDFIAGPSSNSKTGTQQPVNETLASQQTQAVILHNAARDQPAAALSTQTVLANQQQVSQTSDAVNKDQKKDLMAMMLECSDLTAPQKAKGFGKKPVKEVQPVRKNTVVYQESQKAHKWNQAAEQLTELFTLPEGTTPGSGFQLPKWVTGSVSVPDVYTFVYEASLVDGVINTERLYPILLRSNLPRETLGQLWALCNKTTPGQLIKEELYILLAMISIAQNNLDFSSLDILTRCPQAPVPNLGQYAPSSTVIQTDHASPPVTAGVPPVSTTSTPDAVIADIVVQGNSSEIAKDDDFSDFQSGPFITGETVQSGSHDFTATVSSTKTVSSNSVSVTISRNGTTAGSDSITVDFHSVPTEKEEREEDIDEYFRNMQALPATTNTLNVADTFKKISKHKSNVAVKPVLVSHRLETSFPISSDTETFTTATDATMPDFDSFATFPGSQSESSSSQSQGWPSSSSLSGLTSASSNTDDIADFASAGTGTPADDFADFQQAPDVDGMPDKGADKISALKALIMNKDLYSEKPKIETKPDPDITNTKEDGWTTFPSVTAQEGTPETTDTSPDLENITPVAEPSATVGFFTDSISASHGKQKDWALFVMPTKPGPDLTAAIAQDTESVIHNKAEGSAVHEELKREQKLNVDKAKSEKLFAKNMVNSGLVVPAFSAFDLAPPELPEVKDDDVDDEFDEFGTFQSGAIPGTSSSEGISALAMGLDDLPDFNFVTAKTQSSSQNLVLNNVNGKDSSDTVSTASQEFSGWRNQSKSSQKEDTQSMNSLDLRISHKDESPSSVDCQSISSLEFSVGDASRKSATPQDQRSVASLELKTTSEIGSDDAAGTPDVPAVGVESVGDVGGILSASTIPHSNLPGARQTDWNFEEKPRDVSELLTHGRLPAIGDRYSGLTRELQDTDKHTYYWQCCLEKNKDVLVTAMETFQCLTGSDIAQEIVNSKKGGQYMRGIVEVYRVFCRIKQAMKWFSISNHKLEGLVEVIEDTWASLTIFISNTPILPERAALDFSKGTLKAEPDDNQSKACGVCVLSVEIKSNLSDQHNEHKLTYGGRQYHSSCANFWINCVDSTLPSLCIPELL